MSLAPGTTLGPYTIDEAIGAGGMGEVYRATDTRLGRKVAIKVLPDDVAANPDRLARFEREARALAALSHFNVAQVYGFEGHALVMELLEGDTLRERLANGPLPIRKAIDYATQMARGLAAAHDRGIIHRDLKPENVFVLTDGHVKILDFGLARLDSRADGAIATQTARLSTAPGVVMGTVGYMSPEQVRGEPVDGRSDLFSLGAVLYEMLTGQRAFRRDSTVETMSAILNEHPREVVAQRPDVGASLDRIVQHCLEKNPVERFQSSRDVAFALDSLSGSAPSVSGTSAAAPGSWPRERIAWVAVTALLAIALVWLSIPDRTPVAPPPAMSRTLLLLPAGVGFNEVTMPATRLAIAPDGSRLIFQGRSEANSRAQLFVLPLDGGAAVPITDTESASTPFWSPDSRQVMFNITGDLVRLPIDGGARVQVSRGLGLTAGVTAVGSWGSDGTLLVGGPTLRRVRVNDGSTSTLLDSGDAERYGVPQWLADGRYLVHRYSTTSNELSLVTGRIGSPDTRVLMGGPDFGKGVYASGALVFTQGDTLFAQRVEEPAFTLVGEPVTIAEDVETIPLRGSVFAVSDNGMLVYQAATRDRVQLTWFDRRGTAVSTIGDEGDPTNVELSGDNRRALVSMVESRTQSRDIFVVDLERGIRQRFTTDPSDERSAIWSPDGTRVIFNSKGLDLYARAADSSGDEQRIVIDGLSKDPYDWSADGRHVLYRRSGADTANDVWIAPADGSGPGRAIAATRFSEVPGSFSPDGRFVVYSSDESGRREVYVVRVDGGGKAQISNRGGTYPIWRGDGREITYLGFDSMLMGVAVEISGNEVRASLPRALFALSTGATLGRAYDITADGQRVLATIPVRSSMPRAFTVITNWPRLLEK